MDPFLDEEQSGGGGFDPVSLLRAFWRRKILFFVPFVLCLSMAGIAIKTMTPIYASSGQILIKFEGLNSNLLTDPSSRFGRERNIDGMAFHQMNMLLTSPEFLEKMVMELRLQEALRAAPVAEGEVPMSEERAVRRAQSRLASMVQFKQDGPRLFRLEVRDPDPEQAFKLATFVLNRFVEEYRASQMSASTSTLEFLQKQLDVFQQDLSTAETALTAFQSGMASESLVNNPINAMNLGTAQLNLGTARERYNGTDATEMADVGQGMRNLLGSVPGTAKYMADDIVKSTIAEMEVVGLELGLYPASTRDTRELETRLGQLRVRLNTRIEDMVALEYPNLSYLDRTQISHFVYFSLYRAGARRVQDRLETKIQEFRDFTARRPGQSSRIAELQQDVTTARGLVASIETEITQQTMNLEASMSEIGMQIRIRRVPHLVYQPVEPNKLKLTLMGVILSLGIGLGLVILAIFLDRSFYSVKDIERTLGLTVIGTLPVIQDDHFERKKKVRILRWATIILGIVAVGAVGFLVIYPRLG
ncbi:MAG: Wzz/FepE/Etk N-terminal domain-containing protein [Candidatus Krumholzibacteria bacterium]|nr:Wzz/FepE/Etk N-terminal domain-containing protein [Candidatus Krumholzibacteria bacterium]